MRKLLLKIFIKDYKNTQDSKVRAKYGTLSGLVGIFSNLILCAFKILAGVLSASISIIADGINNLSDAGSSIVTLIGFKLSNKPADEDHPFGHERIEYLTGVIVSFVILAIGGILLYNSVQKIINPEEIMVSWVIYLILGVSVLVKLWQAIFNYKNGKAINSTALIAVAQDSRNDCITTVAVIIGMIIFDIWALPVDGYIGVIVSIFILISGIQMLKETMNPLIGEVPPKEQRDMITQKVLSYEGILGVHDLVIHNYGPNKTFATIHAEVSSSADIMYSHDIIDNIERDFRRDVNIDLVIHMDPIDTTDPRTLELKEVVNQILADYDVNLTMHDFRVVHGVTHTNVLFDVVIPIKYSHSPQEVRESISEMIKKYDNKLQAVIQIDQMYDRNN